MKKAKRKNAARRPDAGERSEAPRPEGQVENADSPAAREAALAEDAARSGDSRALAGGVSADSMGEGDRPSEGGIEGEEGASLTEKMPQSGPEDDARQEETPPSELSVPEETPENAPDSDAQTEDGMPAEDVPVSGEEEPRQEETPPSEDTARSGDEMSGPEGEADDAGETDGGVTSDGETEPAGRAGRRGRRRRR